MIVFQNRRPALVAALAVCALAAGQAFAAEKPTQRSPVSGWRTTKTRPPLKLAPAPRPTSVAPIDKTQTVPGAPFADESEGKPTGDISVEVGTLEEIDPDSVGLLDAGKGGFGADMWKGTSRPLVERLLPLIPGAIQSPTLRDMARRLLLSRATVPAGKRSASIQSLRVRKLLALGDVQGAIGLVQAGLAKPDDERLMFAEVESRFIENDNAGACKRVREVASSFAQPYWQQALVYCLELAGEHERSAMVSDILRESGGNPDGLFFSLIDALSSQEPAEIASLANPRGLHLSMTRAASVKLPADVVQSKTLAILRTVVFSPNADIELRLRAAERLVAAWAISSAEIAKLYNSIEFSPPELADPMTSAAAAWGPRARALLVRAASTRTTSRARADFLRKAWNLSRDRGDYPVLLRASVPVLWAIEPSVGLLDFAGDAAWALYATGNGDRAFAWFELVRAHAPNNPVAAKALAMLQPLAHLATAQDKLIWDQKALEGWWEAINSANAETARTTAAMVYSLLEATGKPVGPVAWSQLVGRPGAGTSAVADVALWKSLRAASEGGRVGETVLYALIALGAGGPKGANALSVSAVVTALQRVGLANEARALAVEAAVAAGA